MIKCLIVEDEIYAMQLFEKLLHSFFKETIQLVDAVTNVEEAVLSIERNKPDLVFLDIELKGEKGFDLFKYFDNPFFETVFTSAHKKYGVEACKQVPFDYLLKPINFIDLKEVISKFERRKAVKFIDNAQFISSSAIKFNKVTFPIQGGYIVEDISNILYCEALDNYSKVHFLDGRNVVVTKTLKYIEEMLGEELFFRIHKSYLVNLNHVVQYGREEGYHVILNTGISLDVSYRKNESLVRKLTNK